MLCPGSNPSRPGTTASSDVGEPLRTRTRGTRASSAPRGRPGARRARDCAGLGRRFERFGRSGGVVQLGVMDPAGLGGRGRRWERLGGWGVVVQLGVMDPACWGGGGGGGGGGKGVDNARDIH